MAPLVGPGGAYVRAHGSAHSTPETMRVNCCCCSPPPPGELGYKGMLTRRLSVSSGSRPSSFHLTIPIVLSWDGAGESGNG